MLPNVGPLELIVVMAIALMIFGPKRLPEMGRSVGKGIREFKSSVSGDDDVTLTEEDGFEVPVLVDQKPVATTAATATAAPVAKTAAVK
jgi:sec-independent protein translocase protein TatA